MPITLISELFRAHPYASVLMAITLFTLAGYLEIRAFPRERGAYWTLVFVLLIIAFGLHRTIPGELGVLLAMIVLAGGIIWLVNFHSRHAKPRK